MIDYHNRKFRPVSQSENSETNSETLFLYVQTDDIVSSYYFGGEILKGQLIAKVNKDGTLDMRYQQVNKKGELMTGICQSTPEILPDGRIRLHEKWRWTSGDFSEGESILDELTGAS